VLHESFTILFTEHKRLSSQNKVHIFTGFVWFSLLFPVKVDIEL